MSRVIYYIIEGDVGRQREEDQRTNRCQKPFRSGNAAQTLGLVAQFHKKGHEL